MGLPACSELSGDSAAGAGAGSSAGRAVSPVCLFSGGGVDGRGEGCSDRGGAGLTGALMVGVRSTSSIKNWDEALPPRVEPPATISNAAAPRCSTSESASAHPIQLFRALWDVSLLAVSVSCDNSANGSTWSINLSHLCSTGHAGLLLFHERNIHHRRQFCQSISAGVSPQE